MAEPSGPINGQNRVVEGLVSTGGVAGLKKGANASAVTGSAYQALDTVVGGAGTAGTPAPDVVTVQGISGGTPMPVSGTITASGVAQDTTLGTTNTEVGGLTDAAPASDTASASLNGRLQRIAQRLSSLIALLPTSLGTGGGLKVDGSGTPLPVSASALPLPTGAATDATVAAMSAKLPAALGQQTMAASEAVVIASDQSAIPITAASLPLPAGAAADGTDPVGTNAGAQAGSTTAGVGIRGWLSTLAGIFQSVGGKVQGLGTAGSPLGGVVTVQGGLNGSGSLPGTPGQNITGTPGTNQPTAYVLAAQMALNGGNYYYGSMDWLRTPAIFKTVAAVAVTAGTPVSIWTPAATRFRLMGGGLSLSVAGSIIFKDGATGGSATEIWRTPTLAAGQPYNIPENIGNGILSAAANNQLWIDVTASGTVMGGVFGTEE